MKEKKKLTTLASRVAFRFLRGFIAGAVSTAAAVTGFNGVKQWEDLENALAMLLIAIIIGGVTGGLMAADKFIRDKRDKYDLPGF